MTKDEREQIMSHLAVAQLHILQTINYIYRASGFYDHPVHTKKRINKKRGEKNVRIKS